MQIYNNISKYDNRYSMEDLRYPIGKFAYKGAYSAQEKDQLILQIAEIPALLREAVNGLSENQLDTPYREEGWTVRQVIHHLPDSHANAYIRFKLALTEDNPTIKPYHEDRWATLPDTFHTPIEVSLAMLEAIHFRWVMLLKNMQEKDFEKTYFHPESQKVFNLEYVLGMYVWHGQHHIAQITSLRARKHW
ncbi:MAG: bacillithiol transferase BstA [Thermoflexibacter sp.]